MSKQEVVISELISPALIGQSALLRHIHYYSKNANSEYIDCNEPVAHGMNLASLSDIKGLNDHSFGWSDDRIHFLRQHDLAVMEGNAIVCKLEEPFKAPDGKLMQLISYKVPLYDNNKPIGIAGISIDILSSHFLSGDNLNVLSGIVGQHHRLNNHSTYHLLSDREKQCVQLYLAGKTSKDTAILLGLSHRTIEEYFINVKSKLGLKAKRQLFDLLKMNS